MTKMLGSTVLTFYLGPTFPDNPAILSLAEAERRHIVDVLQKTCWRLAGRGGAAEILGLKRTTLQSKMKKLGIRRPTGG